MTPNHIAARLYAALAQNTPENAAKVLDAPGMERTKTIYLVYAAEAQAIIAEREAAARKEARRECYNAVCEQFMEADDDRGIWHNHGVTACRDAIAKIIEETENG